MGRRGLREKRKSKEIGVTHFCITTTVDPTMLPHLCRGPGRQWFKPSSSKRERGINRGKSIKLLFSNFSWSYLASEKSTLKKNLLNVLSIDHKVLLWNGHLHKYRVNRTLNTQSRILLVLRIVLLFGRRAIQAHDVKPLYMLRMWVDWNYALVF